MFTKARHVINTVNSKTKVQFSNPITSKKSKSGTKKQPIGHFAHLSSITRHLVSLSKTKAQKIKCISSSFSQQQSALLSNHYLSKSKTKLPSTPITYSRRTRSNRNNNNQENDTNNSNNTNSSRQDNAQNPNSPNNPNNPNPNNPKQNTNPNPSNQNQSSSNNPNSPNNDSYQYESYPRNDAMPNPNYNSKWTWKNYQYWFTPQFDGHHPRITILLFRLAFIYMCIEFEAKLYRPEEETERLASLVKFPEYLEGFQKTKKFISVDPYFHLTHLAHPASLPSTSPITPITINTTPSQWGVEEEEEMGGYQINGGGGGGGGGGGIFGFYNNINQWRDGTYGRDIGTGFGSVSQSLNSNDHFTYGTTANLSSNILASSIDRPLMNNSATIRAIDCRIIDNNGEEETKNESSFWSFRDKNASSSSQPYSSSSSSQKFRIVNGAVRRFHTRNFFGLLPSSTITRFEIENGLYGPDLLKNEPILELSWGKSENEIEKDYESLRFACTHHAIIVAYTIHHLEMLLKDSRLPGFCYNDPFCKEPWIDGGTRSGDVGNEIRSFLQKTFPSVLDYCPQLGLGGQDALEKTHYSNKKHLPLYANLRVCKVILGETMQQLQKNEKNSTNFMFRGSNIRKKRQFIFDNYHLIAKIDATRTIVENMFKVIYNAQLWQNSTASMSWWERYQPFFQENIVQLEHDLHEISRQYRGTKNTSRVMGKLTSTRELDVKEGYSPGAATQEDCYLYLKFRPLLTQKVLEHFRFLLGIGNNDISRVENMIRGNEKRYIDVDRSQNIDLQMPSMLPRDNNHDNTSFNNKNNSSNNVKIPNNGDHHHHYHRGNDQQDGNINYHNSSTHHLFFDHQGNNPQYQPQYSYGFTPTDPSITLPLTEDQLNTHSPHYNPIHGLPNEEDDEETDENGNFGTIHNQPNSSNFNKTYHHHQQHTNLWPFHPNLIMPIDKSSASKLMSPFYQRVELEYNRIADQYRIDHGLFDLSPTNSHSVFFSQKNSNFFSNFNQLNSSSMYSKPSNDVYSHFSLNNINHNKESFWKRAVDVIKTPLIWFGWKKKNYYSNQQILSQYRFQGFNVDNNNIYYHTNRNSNDYDSTHGNNNWCNSNKFTLVFPRFRGDELSKKIAKPPNIKTYYLSRLQQHQTNKNYNPSATHSTTSQTTTSMTSNAAKQPSSFSSPHLNYPSLSQETNWTKTVFNSPPRKVVYKALQTYVKEEQITAVTTEMIDLAQLIERFNGLDILGGDLNRVNLHPDNKNNSFIDTNLTPMKSGHNNRNTIQLTKTNDLSGFLPPWTNWIKTPIRISPQPQQTKRQNTSSTTPSSSTPLSSLSSLSSSSYRYHNYNEFYFDPNNPDSLSPLHQWARIYTFQWDKKNINWSRDEIKAWSTNCNILNPFYAPSLMSLDLPTIPKIEPPSIEPQKQYEKGQKQHQQQRQQNQQSRSEVALSLHNQPEELLPSLTEQRHTHHRQQAE